MKHLFTYSPKKFGSRLIKWGLNQDCSHYALEFFSDMKNDALILESRFPSGPRIRSKKKFLEQNVIVHSVNMPLPKKKENQIFFSACKKLLGLKYDWPAILFFAWWALKNKLTFGMAKRPKKNPLGKDDLAFCSEVLFLINQEFHFYNFDKIDSEMISPHECYELLIK